MGRDMVRRDVGALLLALLATASFALAATGHAVGEAFLTGLLANLLSQRYWKRELDLSRARNRAIPPRWVMATVFLTVILCIGIIHWSGTPFRSATTVCAIASAFQAILHLRRLAATHPTSTNGLPG